MAQINTHTDIEKQDTSHPLRPISTDSKDSTNPSQILLTIEQYRVLVGIPQDSSRPLTGGDNAAISRINGSTLSPISPHVVRRSTIDSETRTKPRVMIFLGLLKRPGWRSRGKGPHNCDEVNEYPTSLYYAVKKEETDQWSQFHLYNFITYACLVLQLVIASALIVIGAIPTATNGSAHRIAIAVLGAITGLFTGVLSLLKGQGLPNRFLQFASRLRDVRTNIEFKDRILRSGASTVSYKDVLDILDQYETVLNERDMNRPDTWTTQVDRETKKKDRVT